MRRYEPNAESRAALAEYEEIKKNPEAYKRYDSFDDALNEVLNDIKIVLSNRFKFHL